MSEFKTDCDIWRQQAQFYKTELENHLSKHESLGDPFVIGAAGLLGVVLGFIVGREGK